MRALAWQTVSIVLALLVSTATAFVPVAVCAPRPLSHLDASAEDDSTPTSVHRRGFLSQTIASVGMVAAAVTSPPQPAQAIGPVKLALEPRSYQAAPCPPSKPIPGEKAMFGMRGLCVTVKADLIDTSPKDLEKVGVYGFVVDAETGNSVLANNPDLSTDAGQFAMIESVTTKDKTVEFEFVAAVPTTKDISQYENGIGPLEFDSLRIVSFPGGQQYGAINPCEMNEFSDECEAWEAENGPYEKGEYMDSINRDGGIFFFATALVVPQFFRPHRNQWASEVVVCAIPPYNPTPCPYNFATPRQQRMAARKAVSTAPLLVPPRGPLFTRVQTGLGRLVAQSSGGGHANNGLAEHTKTKKTTTQLTTIAHQAPFRWIPLTASAVAQAGAAAVVASNYGGGLLPGDAYHSTVHVQSDATLYVGTQGATRVYPQPQYATTTAADDAADNSSSQHCRPSIVTARYDVEAGGLLVVAPDPFTPLADSVWQQRQSIHLHHRQSGNDSNNNTVNDASDYASICWIDWVAAGRTARGEHWEARHGTSRTEFWCHINHQDAAEHPSPPKYPTLVDATRFDPAIARAALGPCAAYATVILVGPQVAAVRRRCRRLATALTRLHTATRQEEEEDDDNRHHGSASETSIHDNTLVNAADDNDGRTDWDVDALMANMAGPVYMGATAVDDNMAVVRLAATNNDDVYRVLHGALLPLQERLGLAVYGDRIRAVKSAGAPRAVPKDPSSAASTFRKPLNSDTAKPVSNLPSSMSPAVAWAAHMLTDSNLPTGGFAHSAGLEVAAQVGWLGALSTQSESSSPSSEEEAIATYAAATVHSTLSQVTPTLRRIHHTIAANGQLDAATWHDIQHELHALLRTNRPACEASLDQGASLWRLAQLNWIPSTVVTALSASTSASSSTPLHFAPVFGLVTATWGLSLEESRHLLAYSIGRDVVSAAVRLNRVGPLASVPLLARLHEAIPTLDHDSDPENDFAASTAPVLEALQPLHDVLAVRLFRT